MLLRFIISPLLKNLLDRVTCKLEHTKLDCYSGTFQKNSVKMYEHN